MDAPFSHRRHLLRTLFPVFSDKADPTKARFQHVESLDSTTCEDPRAEMQAFFQGVVEQKCEGLMVKLLESGEGLEGDDAEVEVDGEDAGGGKKRGKKEKGSGGQKKPLPATYEPDQRSQGWLKVKKGELHCRRADGRDQCPALVVLTRQTTLKVSVIVLISSPSAPGGDRDVKRVGGVRSCWRVTTPRLALWKRSVNVS